jgi:hypothetical protein
MKPSINYRNIDYWVFVTPELLPRDFSLVARSGTDGFVCLVKSSNTVLFPQELTMGYLDCKISRKLPSIEITDENVAAMTEYLLLQALKLSPKLLIEVGLQRVLAHCLRKSTDNLHSGTNP